MSDKQQFGEHYRRLADDELARLALENHLVADAKEALADELKRRKISDLSEYKKTLDESKAQRTAARELQFQSNGLQQFRLWALVCIAWLLAVAGPFIFAANPHDSNSLKVCLLGVLLIAFSCYLGIKAQRAGSRVGYFLKLKLPLILLAISSAIAACIHL